jgi:miniconductance mechanosensitive channel
MKYVEFAPVLARYLSITMMILFIGLICIIANFISKKVVVRPITHYVTNSKFPRVTLVLKRKVFDKLSHRSKSMKN